MNRAFFYISFLATFAAVAIISLPQKLWAEDNRRCSVIWAASQGELRFPDKSAGPNGLSLGREPSDENRIFGAHEIVWGNITSSTVVVVHGWEPERMREVFPMLAGKRVNAQAKVKTCGEGEGATSEILEISIVQLPGRVAVYESPLNLRNFALGLAALTILNGGRHHEGDVPEPRHNSPFNMPPPSGNPY